MMRNSRRTQNDTERRLGGMVGMGKIVDVRLTDYTARVKDGDLVTGWLRMGMMRANGAQQTWPYTKGEEVGYVTISGDAQEGFILCALANGQNTVDARSGVFRAKATGGFELIGDITLTGSLHASGDVVADRISLQNHTHVGVAKGPASTGKPQ